MLEVPSKLGKFIRDKAHLRPRSLLIATAPRARRTRITVPGMLMLYWTLNWALLHIVATRAAHWWANEFLICQMR
jgi:hypothetical protein